MTTGSPEGPSPQWKDIHQSVLASLDALHSATNWLATAATAGIEPIFERVLQHVCEPLGVTPEAYIEVITQDAGMRRDVQKRLSRLMENPKLQALRRDAQRREAEHQLHVLHYMLSGKKPPDWVWSAIDDEQREQLQEAAESGEERNDALLPRVHAALTKLDTTPAAYGRCEDCKAAIPLERLQLVPWAECCAACQRKREGVPDDQPEPEVRVTHF
ncbi:TraR/DksA family transcriptional regulator [Archangium primigenium]|uniref:TraR/DksA family transcriptional regulator n=1 Tax=[Archangium] primigenium TaxID=2792470 RepID=UPI001955FCDC|nr:TraR/DksA family transcriptional regulator [Archangium primigenium]